MALRRLELLGMTQEIAVCLFDTVVGRRCRGKAMPDDFAP